MANLSIILEIALSLHKILKGKQVNAKQSQIRAIMKSKVVKSMQIFRLNNDKLIIWLNTLNLNFLYNFRKSVRFQEKEQNRSKPQ